MARNDGGPDDASFRDRLAMDVMFKALDKDWALWRDYKFLAAQSYRIADAMLAARNKEAS
jgi:hypothetical protein